MLRARLVLAGLLGLLLTAPEAHAWGAYHAGFTHVGPGGVYHYGRTAAVGPYGAYRGGGYRYGYGYGYGDHHYGYAYPYGGYPPYYGYTPGYGGYEYGGFHTGGYYGGGYRAGVYRAW